MKCDRHNCDGETEVIYTKRRTDNVLRRRRCKKCDSRFSTIEQTMGDVRRFSNLLDSVHATMNRLKEFERVLKGSSL